MVRVAGVDAHGDVVDEGGVGVALLFERLAAVAVLQPEHGLVADVPHEHAGVVPVRVDPVGELLQHAALVAVVGHVVHAAAAAGAAAGLEPESGDDLDVVGRGRVQQRLAGGVGAPGADRVDAHGAQVGQILPGVGGGGPPGEALDLVGAAVHGQLPVALAAGHLDDAARRRLCRLRGQRKRSGGQRPGDERRRETARTRGRRVETADERCRPAAGAGAGSGHGVATPAGSS